MKTKTLFLGLFLVLGIFIAGCTTGNVVGSDNTNKEENSPNLDSSNLKSGTYKLNLETSVIEWSASKIVGNSHTGTVNLKSGSLNIDKEHSGNFVIDMSTIKSNENLDSLIKHLKGDDFFKTETYPEAKVVVTSIKKLNDDNYEVTADLTILDKTNSITFPATLTLDDKTLYAKAKFNIDRTKWEITYGSGSIFKDLGDKAIKDEVSFDLDLKFELIQ